MMKVMNRQLALAMLAVSLAAVSGYAQNSQPSAKVTAKTANLTLLPPTTTQGEWHTVLANSIKTANQKDLFISAAFEIGLYTDTLVKSRNMVSDTSTAKASVKVRVVLDLGTSAQRVVEPGEVVYGRRQQTLTATLEGAIAGCLTVVTNADGSLGIALDPLCVTPEEIGLILDTMDAASFNFVAVNVPQGVHTVSVQAQIDTSGTVQNGTFEARALVGKGAVTVESVRLIKNANVEVADVP
jgi:hypothetical protein